MPRPDYGLVRRSRFPDPARGKAMIASAPNPKALRFVRFAACLTASAAVARATPLFAEQCSACHGPEGKGDPKQGAPNLTDGDWLYGADRASISGQIHAGRGGVMPAWGQRFSPETLKALAVYIHANAGGQDQ